MSKSTALKKTETEESESVLIHEIAFVRAFYDYKIGKPLSRTVLTPGLEPHFYDLRLKESTQSITNRKLNSIEKQHKTLARELAFFANVAKQQEKTAFNAELHIYLNGWLGALYAGLTLDSPDVLNLNPKEDFESFCRQKLAHSIFIEQERYCLQLVGISVESQGRAPARTETDQFMSVDELRDDIRDELPSFLKWLAAYLSKHQSIIDCLNGAASSRRFYWEIGCEFLNKCAIQDDSTIKSVSECFPGILVEYSAGTKIQINTDAPDPIVRLHRLLYRPNSQDLFRDCKSVLEDTTNVEVKLKVADWLRPYTKHVFAQLGLGFMTKTTQHHRIKLELDHFMLNFVVSNSTTGRAPSTPETISAVKTFIKFKQDNPELVQYFDRKGQPTKKSAESFYEKMNSDANFLLEDNLQEIQSRASTLKLLGKSADTPRKMMVISVGRPGSKRGNATTVVPLIQNIVAQGIWVEVCIGAYCYTEGRDANKVNEEISLVCHVETQKQVQYVEALANFFHQEIYILIDENWLVFSIDLRDGKKREKGTWLETTPVNKNDLKSGDGYSLIDGKFYQAHIFTGEKPLIERHDFGLVSTRFGTFTLNGRQARVIKYMIGYRDGKEEMKASDVLRAVNINGDSIQRVFSDTQNGESAISPAWTNLIYSSRHGFIKLRL